MSKLTYEDKINLYTDKNEKIKTYFQAHWTDVKRKYIALVSGYVKKIMIF